jgi:hypothetical protein
VGLIAECDGCGKTQAVTESPPEGWSCGITGMLCRQCNLSRFLPAEGHPETDEPFVEVVLLTQEQPVRTYHAMPPSPPTRVEEEYGDDGEVTHSRELSEVEYEQACRAYKAALEDFRERGGVFHAPCKTVVSGRFRCPSGAWAEGMQDGEGRWLWSRWLAPPEGYRVCHRCHGEEPDMSKCSYCRGKGVLRKKETV